MQTGTWEAPAKYTRRSAQFRCKCCRRLIAEGETAIFSRKGDQRTRGNRIWAIHAECGDLRHSPSYSWREVLAVWAERTK